MPKDITFMQYMRAHGNTPGPTQRPLLTGAIGGLLAEIPSGAVLYWSGALASIAERFGVDVWIVLAVDAGLMILAGMLYAAIFKRAANDCEGGWLFGAAYGFLLWLFAPVTIWQLFASRPAAVGRAAMGLFAAHILYGLALGLLYPRIHAHVQMRLRDAPKTETAKTVTRHTKPEFPAQTAKVQGGRQ